MITAASKSRLRKAVFISSYVYVIIFSVVMFGFHVGGFEVVSFWPIFSGVIGYLGSLGVANYFTTPQDT